MGLSNRCICIILSVLIFCICIFQIIVMSRLPNEMKLFGYEIPRLTSLALGVLACILLFLGAILKNRVLLWIGIPTLIIMFVIFCIVDIIVFVKYLGEITQADEAFGVLIIILYIIIFPLLICVSWCYANELKVRPAVDV